MTYTVHPPQPRPLTPDGRLPHIPFRFTHSSATLGWRGLRVEHDPGSKPEGDFVQPPLDWLALFILQGDVVPERVDHHCDDARHQGVGLLDAVSVVPPRVESRWRWRNACDSTQYQVSPALIAKVAEEAFDLDPARVHFRACYYDRSSPEVIDTLKALRRELLAGGPGGRLCAESLANVLVVHLIRQMSNRQGSNVAVRGTGDRLPRRALRAVEEYIDAHLDQKLALADLAAVAHMSEFHFARQFKQATGLPPHQFVILQRVERAKRLITDRQLSLAQVAVAVGFSDQSHLTRHFKRVVGVTPSRFA
jgi:AraC family transcriptional regulator